MATNSILYLLYASKNSVIPAVAEPNGAHAVWLASEAYCACSKSAGYDSQITFHFKGNFPC